MEIKQSATHITLEVTKNDKVFSFIIPNDSPFNDVFNVLFECVNKVNDFAVEVRVNEALKKASEPKAPEAEEVTPEVVTPEPSSNL